MARGCATADEALCLRTTTGAVVAVAGATQTRARALGRGTEGWPEVGVIASLHAVPWNTAAAPLLRCCERHEGPLHAPDSQLQPAPPRSKAAAAATCCKVLQTSVLGLYSTDALAASHTPQPLY